MGVSEESPMEISEALCFVPSESLTSCLTCNEPKHSQQLSGILNTQLK